MIRVEPCNNVAKHIWNPSHDMPRRNGWANVYPWGYACIHRRRNPGDQTIKPIYRIRVKWKDIES